MKVNEIFSSVNGEICSQHQGSLCTFIRLQGCNFWNLEAKGFKLPGCSYCDTIYAQDPNLGVEMTEIQILNECIKLGNKNITVTGGEPLLQGIEALLTLLSKGGYFISVETNGSIPIPYINEEDISFVADWKLPSSGMNHFMSFDRFTELTDKDFIKFVCSNFSDFSEAMRVFKLYCYRISVPKFAFSPVSGKLSAEELCRWMKEERILGAKGAVLSIQLHKILGVK